MKNARLLDTEKIYIMSDAYHSILLTEKDNEMYAIGIRFSPKNEEEFVESLRSDIDEFIISNSKAYEYDEIMSYCHVVTLYDDDFEYDEEWEYYEFPDELTALFSELKYFSKEEVLKK